ncbi:endolytic transglycosylase MltG [Gandjariella thermophila]|uniref:Endolytic murein transglycosylase n=1 Tax=Gandjariella thermophila TaxID=1931992 RepID=A0A4D4J136_9PSEU|nr:endolytic transglycosylase MltG [Gandjariella thermophila]GDY28850.1 hypothetical protein GTS_04830 [Gandjariella thermophila]
MNDDLGLFDPATEAAEDDRPRRRGRPPGKPGGKARPRRRSTWVAVITVLVLVLGGAAYGAAQLLGLTGYADYSGDGDADLIVQVQPGDSTSAIGNRLQQAGVVASARAFTKAAASDSRVRSLQPGYYLMRTHMSGKAAVARMVDPHTRVSGVEIRAGYQLDDVTAPDGSTDKGILSRIADASCTDLGGKKSCVSSDELHKVAETADPAALGVPDWAIPDVQRADPRHRLEGLIAPGIYDVKPGASAFDVLKSVVTTSAQRWRAIGMPQVAGDTGFRPYEVLIMASLVQREAIVPDFGKVARVTYNRLAIGMPLGYDSTINYVLDRPMITTKTADRNAPGPYNTYLNSGLPPTPIGTPSPEALTATAHPPKGSWLFFVKCQKDGTSCFADTPEQHDQNVRDAQARGIF